jgi:hypothetical protein
MAKFAKEVMQKMKELVRQLEVSLGTLVLAFD